MIYFSRKNTWDELKSSFIATKKGEEIPKVPAKIEIFQHKVQFVEVLSASLIVTVDTQINK